MSVSTTASDPSFGSGPSLTSDRKVARAGLSLAMIDGMPRTGPRY